MCVARGFMFALVPSAVLWAGIVWLGLKITGG